VRSDVKLAGTIGAALLVAILVFSSFFTVGQNELTVVNRFGEFRYVAGPGLHFKVP
jgi:regulator of protease activity HflC (stomatin/prohibitin superfamily)